MMKKFTAIMKKWTVRCAVFGTLFFMCLSQSIVYADSATEKAIRQKETQVEAARKERKSLQKNITNLQDLKKQLEASKSDLNAYITKLDSNLAGIQTNIQNLKIKITEKEEEITRTEQELEAAQEKQDEQYASMKERVRFMYERGDSFYLDMILQAGSFAEMLNKAEYIEEVSKYDRSKLEEYIQQKELIALTKESLEEEKMTLDEAKGSLEKEESNMQAMITEKQIQLEGVASDIKNKEAAIAAYEAGIAKQDAEIAALEKAIAADKAKLAAEQQRHFGGGVFTWPCPSYSGISSEYGWRIHPIYGYRRFHNGLDMAAATGAPIVAAAPGNVVASAYNASMGNYVMVDHGDGIYTIYMHASALYVSSGQSVTAGQQIAAVGSTGNSTGPHLHFSVRVNGSYVSPWNYLK